MKIQTLAIEVDRRMSNMDRDTTESERLEVLEKFITKMKDSGYGHGTRCEILNSGLV